MFAYELIGSGFKSSYSHLNYYLLIWYFQKAYKKVLEFTTVLRLQAALQFAYQIVRLVKKLVIAFLQVIGA